MSTQGGTESGNEALAPLSSEAEAVLVENHRRFVHFVRSRVQDPSLAEELVQASLLRALEHGLDGLDREGLVNWFYRVLQNAIIDHQRRGSVEQRALQREGREAATAAEDPELRSTVCACMHDLLPTLKPEYAQLVREVDLEQRPVGEVAREVGITANNASVRLHRARQALKTQLQRTCQACAAHGCLDCSCRQRPTVAPA